MEKIYSGIIGLIAGLILGVLLSVEHYRANSHSARSDTITVIDTICYAYPVQKDSAVTRYVVRKLPVATPATEPQGTDSVAVQEADEGNALLLAGGGDGGLARQRDSATVVVPIERKVYRDSTYEAWVSGYLASLDSIRTFNRTTTITVREPESRPPERLSVGVSAGYGYGRRGLTPFVGIGVSYSVFPLTRKRK